MYHFIFTLDASEYLHNKEKNGVFYCYSVFRREKERGGMMKINSRVHLIRKDFFVTPQVKRYVNIYLIEGRYCYLIDSGVAGTQTLIGEYMKTINRSMEDIRGIFLTHSHPDHIGAAAELKRQTNCKIYAPMEEVSWIEDIRQQYKERPIPNFFHLLSEDVQVDCPINDGDEMELEEGIRIRALSTKGHSHGSMSYILNQELVFTGDAIPVENDVPIFVDYGESLRSLTKLSELPDVSCFCPAWDDIYDRAEVGRVMGKGKKLLNRLREAALQVEKDYASKD